MNETESLLNQIFEKLYDRITAILDKSNPCEHKVTKGCHSCLGKNVPFSGNSGPQCCCVGCPFWDKGCKAEKPLTCRAWLCGSAMNKHPIIYSRMKEVNGLISKYKFWVCRGDKKASMNLAMRYNEFSVEQLKIELAKLS